MLVIDEYLAVRVLVGARPAELDEDEPLALPAYRHYRLLQRIHAPGDGQLSVLLADSDQQAMWAITEGRVLRSLKVAVVSGSS